MNEIIPDRLGEIHWQACGLDCPMLTGGKCKKDSGEWCTGPKFDSAAAEILWDWSLDSGQDENCGDAVDGYGWYALFRPERAILHTDSQGFVSAWRVPESDNLEDMWYEIDSHAVYLED
ncbi:MAG: hypothetical protein IJI97_05995 [Clostridia bacterium]|nr:hypothetical protein [Clostridia bacterium]